jgi:hypothetical protein
MKVTSELKSKVFVIGNKLSANMDRSAAFELAWRLVYKGGIELSVRGVTYGSRQVALQRLAAYNPTDVRTYLVPEPENEVDRNAIAVMVGVQGGRGIYKLGYIPASQTNLAAVLIGKLPALRILSGDIYGARIAVNV